MKKEDDLLKWTNWDNGLHTSLIARWPGQIPANVRTQAIVQYTDIVPTLLDLVGQKPDPEKFDGTSFAAVLHGERETHREFAYGMHNNFPEGPSYPIRSVTNGEWRYIRNLTPEKLYIEKHLLGKNDHNPYRQTWVFSSFSKSHHEMLVNRYMKRPAEQLYHTTEDPFEMTNLATNPTHVEIKKHLSAALDVQLKEQGDPGIPLIRKKPTAPPPTSPPSSPANRKERGFATPRPQPKLSIS